MASTATVLFPRARALVFAATLAALTALAACAPLDDRPAPVEERSIGAGPGLTLDRGPAVAADDGRVPAGPGGEHVVERGDTLYAIAFRSGVDYRELARWNAIPEPYVIQVGQRLRLAAPVASAPRPVSDPAGSNRTTIAEPSPGAFEPLDDAPVASAPRPNAPTAPSAPSNPATPSAPAPVNPVIRAPREPVAAADPVPASAAPPTLPASVPVAGAVAPSPTAPAVMGPAARATRTAEGLVWRWPTDGRVIQNFVAGDPTRQGIDISGTEGQPVVAVADGEVVYSGNGLIGFGELVIVKHSAGLLSAYGHNRKRLVAEGAKVTAGQVIAEMGRSGGAVPMLHFEIRRNGRPVDPRGFLPER